MRALRVGFTYDLRETWRAEGFDEEETAEFDSLETVEAIAGHLAARGFTVDRIGHHRALVARLAAGERWDLVFNICEGLRGFGREALVPALCEAYGIPCVFSDSLVLALALHKGHAKRVVRDAGVPTAPFMVIEHARDLAVLDLDFPVFAKPVAEGTGKGWSVRAAARTAAPSPASRPTCSRASASPCWSRPIFPAASSRSASSARGRRRARSRQWRCG